MMATDSPPHGINRGVAMARLNETTITVFNNTTSTLTRINQRHNEGGFKSSPLPTVGPGVQFTFGSRENFGEREKGDDGFVIYDIGGIGQTFCDPLEQRRRRDQPNSGHSERQQHGPLRRGRRDPGGGWHRRRLIHLSDAPRLTEDDFTRDKPVEADEPTLRFGDESVDGWAEYLQRLLVVKGHGPLADNDSFDDATLAAVRAFQHRMNTTPGAPSTGRVFVDGVVGNPTWALLREEDAPPPSTDGREPHSFVEQGREARWLTEDSASVFLKEDDRLVIQGVSTGDTPIESGAFNVPLS